MTGLTRGLIGAAVVVAAALGAQAAAQAADGAFKSATGEYVWNPKTSHYSTPVYAERQTMSVTHDDGKTIGVSQDVTLTGGKKIDWSYDGAYDGQPHNQGWITIAFKRIAPNAFSNDYAMADGSQGHEVATVSDRHITIRGHARTADGKESSYVEVWDKVK